MANYLLAFRGGMMPETEEEGEKLMAVWGAWFESLGSSVVLPGNPFGQSVAVKADGSTSEGGKASLTGYTVISADSLELAGKAAAGCPIFDNGGDVDVYETIDM